MSVHVVAYVTCDTPGCMASHRGPEPRTVNRRRRYLAVLDRIVRKAA